MTEVKAEWLCKEVDYVTDGVDVFLIHFVVVLTVHLFIAVISSNNNRQYTFIKDIPVYIVCII